MSEHLTLGAIRDLACRFVPAEAADSRLYEYGYRSWWPAHEIGHFLVATPRECHQPQFGIDGYVTIDSQSYRYAITREIAAMSISQRLLRRAGHSSLADEEIEYTDENTLADTFEPWCRRAVRRLLRANSVARLPRTRKRLEGLLTRKACEAGTAIRSVRHLTRAPPRKDPWIHGSTQ